MGGSWGNTNPPCRISCSRVHRCSSNCSSRLPREGIPTGSGAGEILGHPMPAPRRGRWNDRRGAVASADLIGGRRRGAMRAGLGEAWGDGAPATSGSAGAREIMEAGDITSKLGKLDVGGTRRRCSRYVSETLTTRQCMRRWTWGVGVLFSAPRRFGLRKAQTITLRDQAH